MRTAITLALLVALGSSARAGGDVGVIVTGEGSMQPQLTAQIEGWLSRHGHTLVPSPLPPDAITALIDCFVIEDQACARGIVEQHATSRSVVIARLDTKNNASNGTRDVTLTAYWFDKGHDAIAERTTCQRCTDQSLRTTADEVMKKLVGASGNVGHVKLKSTPAGARITIDGQAIGVTPLDWDLSPGKHTIAMDKAGLQPASRDIVVVSDKTDVLAIALVPVDEGHGSGLPRIVPIGLLATGGAALATGIVLIAINPAPDPAPKERYYYKTAPPGIGLAIGGAVAGGIGAYLLWFRSPKTTSTPVAAFTSDTAYLGWAGRF